MERRPNEKAELTLHKIESETDNFTDEELGTFDYEGYGKAVIDILSELKTSKEVKNR